MRRLATLALTALVVLPALAAVPAPARAESAEEAEAARPGAPARLVGGDHWRLETPNGAVHVWRPAGYDARTAGTLVYVHGHRSSADHSVAEHRVAEQVAESGVNALLVVPDAQVDNEVDLVWESLGALLAAVERGTGLPPPPGPLVVMGHSGAYKTILAWIGHRELDHVVLLDASYGGEEELIAWLAARPDRGLTIVTAATRKRAAALCERIEGCVTRVGVPADAKKLGKRDRAARALLLRSQYDHMGIVTSGKVIPVVLRRTPLRVVP